MQTLYVILAVFGCSEMNPQCTRVDSAATVWPSVAACEARIDETLSRHADLDYPRIAASCEPSAAEPLIASENGPDTGTALN